MARLNQILAVEHGVKQRATAEFTRLHQDTQKPALMTGQIRTYQPKEEDGETYPEEHQRVQLTAQRALDQMAVLMGELFDITLVKDTSNCTAKGDITVAGKLLAKDVPAAYLVWLKNKLSDVRTFVSKIVVVDPALHWDADPNVPGQRKSQPVVSQRTKKVPRAITLAQPTKEHPAQVTMVQEDVVAGMWTMVKFSGAITVAERDAILDRMELLINAVKFGMEQANAIQAADVKIGKEVFHYLLHG